MTPEFEKAVDGAIDLLGGAYGHKFEVGPATLGAWCVTLGECTPREIEGAACAWVREAGQWPPSAPELLARIMRERATQQHRLKFQRATVLEAVGVDFAMGRIEESAETREAFVKREGRGAYLWWKDRHKWARGILLGSLRDDLHWAYGEHARLLEYREQPIAGRHSIPRLSRATDSLSIPVTAQEDVGGSA